MDSSNGHFPSCSSDMILGVSNFAFLTAMSPLLTQASLCGTDLFHSPNTWGPICDKSGRIANFCFEGVGNPWMSRSMNVLSTSLCKFVLRFYLPFRTCMPSTTGGHELAPAIKGTFQDVWGVLMHLENDGLCGRDPSKSWKFQHVSTDFTPWPDLFAHLEGKCWTNQFACCRTKLLMEEILHQFIGILPYYLQGFVDPGGAGFLPSTVLNCFFLQRCIIETHWGDKWKSHVQEAGGLAPVNSSDFWKNSANLMMGCFGKTTSFRVLFNKYSCLDNLPLVEIRVPCRVPKHQEYGEHFYAMQQEAVEGLFRQVP